MSMNSLRSFYTGGRPRKNVFIIIQEQHLEHIKFEFRNNFYNGIPIDENHLEFLAGMIAGYELKWGYTDQTIENIKSEIIRNGSDLIERIQHNKYFLLIHHSDQLPFNEIVEENMKELIDHGFDSKQIMNIYPEMITYIRKQKIEKLLSVV